MFKITNIKSLGEEYTVSDGSENVISKVQVIPYTEILEAALGVYTDSFGSYQNYLDKSIAVLAGFDESSLNTTLWYATTQEEVSLPELIKQAIDNGYDTIILEHLDDLE